MKWCGISFVSASVLSACEMPVKKAIPYLNQPETIIPGHASWYASTWVRGNEYCPVLVRSRDGRPIKIEGNPRSSVTHGGTQARAQASLLGLYDEKARYKGPLFNGQPIGWQEADRQIIGQLEEISSRGGRMVLVTPTLLSPSTQRLLQQVRRQYPGLRHISWDPVSYAAIGNAHSISFGRNIIPEYHFEKAGLIVSFSADFLGSWLSPVEYAYHYAATRRVGEAKQQMSRHIQFESLVSLTGANADERVPVKPSEEKAILMALYSAMARAAGRQAPRAPEVSYDVESLAGQIMAHRGSSLIVCGHNNLQMQILVNAINELAGSYGSTITTSRSLMAGMSQEEEFEQLVTEMHQGRIQAVMFYQSNPLYSYHDPERLHEALQQTSLSISFACSQDETAHICRYVLPDHHYLESWNDAEFKTGIYSLTQPLIHPLFNTRQFQDSLLQWTGGGSYLEFLRENWQAEIFPRAEEQGGFGQFWTSVLQAGVYETPAQASGQLSLNQGAAADAFSMLQPGLPKQGQLEFSLFSNLALADGQDANNPWLQELPDPVSSVTWDNFAAISPNTARELGLADGDYIRINNLVEIPVLIQPGQANECLSMAVGYGRTRAGITGDLTGTNVYPLVNWNNNNRHFAGIIDSWQKTGSGHRFARTQMQFSMRGRPIVRETNLESYRQDPSSGNELHYYNEKHKVTLYPENRYMGHHWLMMVDLNACTGCSACVIACQAENNIPVIGKEEVYRRRIMHWIRIDRYYSGTPDNPQFVFQPITCQHCDHAPCENVCPVAATPHSREGLNQMAYNRCVGTKYCINNCPYKVRRFNWFAYSKREKFNKLTATDYGRLVLNPDVTVRERGVVEKCSFCVQRLQEAKLKAKNEGRPLRDGEAMTACVAACPSKALVFGDRNDPNSRVAQLLKDPRNYHLLEELHTLPSVGFLTKVRNV